MKEIWRMVGYDAFSDEYYDLNDGYPTREDAHKAATERLLELEMTQPSEESGGQGELGIQDRVFIRRPDGTMYRFIPIPPDTK